MRRILSLLVAAGLLLAMLPATVGAAEPITITYWQYEYKTKVALINELIEQFEAQNPGIKVVHETFPYDAFQQKVASALASGQGPDVVTLFYGWLPLWAKTGYLVPLPENLFPKAEIEKQFVQMAQSSEFNGKLYGIPTAVRSLALFYNADLFRTAGIAGPPQTWDDFVAYARKLTVGQGGRFSRIGYGPAPEGQDHHLVREILTRQFGGQPYSDDGRKVLYAGEAGLKAFTFYTDWVRKDQIGVPRFFPGDANSSYRDGFGAGRIAMIVDGSFAVGSISQAAKFDWKVAELPTLEPGGERANFGSYWVHGLTPRAQGERLEAAAKFLKFITSPEVQRVWLDRIGELPASAELNADPELLKHPTYGPFVRGVPYAYATPFVDESAQRKVMVDAMNAVLLQGANPAEVLQKAAAEEQAVLDEFFR